MNADERQALREKHKRTDNGYEELLCFSCYNNYGEPEPYPCDTIKVLDATEELKFSDLKTEVECDHTYWGSVPHLTNNYEVVEFTYCPKCGEKL